MALKLNKQNAPKKYFQFDAGWWQKNNRKYQKPFRNSGMREKNILITLVGPAAEEKNDIAGPRIGTARHLLFFC
jgi:hypothetical protein